MAVALIDMQLSYILAFMGKTEIAQELSGKIVEIIVGVALGYFCKAYFETKQEKRNELYERKLEAETDE